MTAPVLDIAGAAPDPAAESPLRGPVDLRLPSGELALVRAEDQDMARALVALAAGLMTLAAGRVRLFGQDLATLPRRGAEALRARIGLAPGEGGWLPHLPIEQSLLLARRHHGDSDPAALARDAAALCRHFGLAGIPAESPLDAEAADRLVAPLRARLEPTLAAGAAAIWITRSPRAWDNPGFPARQRLRLSASGLVPA